MEQKKTFKAKFIEPIGTILGIGLLIHLYREARRKKAEKKVK